GKLTNRVPDCGARVDQGRVQQRRQGVTTVGAGQRQCGTNRLSLFPTVERGSALRLQVGGERRPVGRRPVDECVVRDTGDRLNHPHNRLKLGVLDTARTVLGVGQCGDGAGDDVLVDRGGVAVVVGEPEGLEALEGVLLDDHVAATEAGLDIDRVEGWGNVVIKKDPTLRPPKPDSTLTGSRDAARMASIFSARAAIGARSTSSVSNSVSSSVNRAA